MNSLISKEITKKIIKEGMGLIHAEIELINAGDLTLAKRHIIGEDEIHRTVVRMLVDTGAYYMCINEAIREQLQLPVLERRKSRLADDTVLECDVAGPI